MFDITKIPSQKGRITIVTGANAGLGFETTLALAKKEMKVIMACRDLEKAEKAKSEILSKVPNADLEVFELDLSKLKSVHSFASTFLEKHNQLDILINNAGIMVPPYSKTEDGFESQMATNYFSHFLLTGLLLKQITSTPNSRIVSLSSIAHKKGEIHFDDLHWEKHYSKYQAYCQSKVACLIFSSELQRRFEKSGLSTISVAAHPGVSPTELFKHMPEFLYSTAKKTVLPIFTHSPEKGALPTLMAALDPTVKGGQYFGPQGFREMKGNPGIAKRTDCSKDQEIAKKLWETSEELTHFKYQF